MISFSNQESKVVKSNELSKTKAVLLPFDNEDNPKLTLKDTFLLGKSAETAIFATQSTLCCTRLFVRTAQSYEFRNQSPNKDCSKIDKL